MSIFTKTVVSEKAVLLWIIMCAIATIVSALLGGVIIYFIYDCWPVTRIQFGGSCLSKIQPGFLQFLPLVTGVVAGSMATVKLLKTGRE